MLQVRKRQETRKFFKLGSLAKVREFHHESGKMNIFDRGFGKVKLHANIK